jgi:uncharacterized protein (DUF1697 family)
MGSSKKPVAQDDVARHVALLRGINVGGKNRLPMDDLSELLAELGCRDVETYIQSGNAVFAASASVVAGLASKISEGIRKRFGLSVPAVLRSAGELAAVAQNNPFVEAQRDEERLHVAFLADVPTQAQVDTLARKSSTLLASQSPPDAYVVRGRDVYLWLPYGVARSKLTNALFDRGFATVSTVRNWRTVQRLVEMVMPAK